MLIFQPPVNFCSDENIQTIFGSKLEHFLNYRIDYNSISQTVEKVVKKIFFYYTCIRIAVLSTPERAKTGDSSTPSFKGCLGNNKFTYILNNDK
jgi:hypothetical protein